MTLPKALRSRVSSLKKQISNISNLLESGDEDQPEQKLTEILIELCTLVREEVDKQSPCLQELVEDVDCIIQSAVGPASEYLEMLEFIGSWAHNEGRGSPLIKDTPEVPLTMSEDAIRKLARSGLVRATESELMQKMTPKPWNDRMKKHPRSSRLARFRPNLPTLTPTAANPIAMCVYDARCEIKSFRTGIPIKLCLSQSDACLALAAVGAGRDGTPSLYYQLLDKSELADRSHDMELGLADGPTHLTIDDSRKLIFVADGNRVKSYAWETSSGQVHRKPHPVHTLNSGCAKGPVAVLPSNTIIRAGPGGAAVWKTDDIDTHGTTGTDIIEGEDESMVEDSMLDDSDYVEISEGNSPAYRISFTNHSSLSITGWEPLTQTPSTMISYSKHDGDCVAIDFDRAGAVTTRYIGHSGVVADVSVSRGDPQVFLTANSDGYARLFDMRTPLPVLTFDACDLEDSCDTAVLAHPDGIPTVFTGAGKLEQIKVWDVRARASVYELATGNNRVQSLAWDSTRNCLYAATECDHTGYNPGWPKDAWHNNKYFEHAFHAGGDRVYQYAFKDDPSPSIVPT